MDKQALTRITLTPQLREELLDAYVTDRLKIQSDWPTEEQWTANEIREAIEFPHGNPSKPAWSDDVLLSELYQFGYNTLDKFVEENQLIG